MRRPLRVVLVTGGLDAGGAERQMLLLAERLPRDRIAVEFLCLKYPGRYAARAARAGIPIRVLGLKGKRESGWPLPVYAVYLAAIVVRYIAMTARRYDIVDAWLFHSYALAAATRPFARPPVLVAGRRSLSAFKSRFNLGERLADLVARATVDVLVANSEAVKADVVAREHVPGGRIRVIHNGVEIPAPLPPDARRRLRERWCATDDTIVIGCVANYKPHKGLEAVIRAAVAVRARAPGIRVVLVGEGKHRAALEALIAALDAPELVLLNGAEHEARDVYGAFDIAVHASEAEGLPNVVLEAAAAGLPIVATAAGGTVEIVDDGRTGRLVPIGDVPALTAALLELIEDPELRARFGASARADVAVRFGVDRMVEEFTQLYEDIAAGRPRGRFARWGSDLRHGDRTLA